MNDYLVSASEDTMPEQTMCLLCGAPAEETHHLLFGTSSRRLAEQDGITCRLCRKCHKELHYNGKMSMMSKIIGQLIWERWYLTDFGDADEPSRTAREEFRQRYGKSWL